ncbi:hypothetical protein FGIG_01032 [Fasciola gigantica]|uniref:Uncharacterized protein n=1 Tax=Fasciola gigantica TaxID=46835 RepID=A0A504YSV4_FASGI|nr:hypothetical protein FGIG_01032 [Fasciola gigantica]
MSECFLECKTGRKPEWREMQVYPFVGNKSDSCQAVNIETCKTDALRWSATVNIIVFDKRSGYCTFGIIAKMPEQSVGSNEMQVYLKACCVFHPASRLHIWKHKRELCSVIHN